MTFLIDKKTGRQGIETKDINHGKEAFLTITDKTNGEKKNTNKIKQINNAIDQNKEHFINDVARAEVIARMLGIDDVTHNNDNVGVGIVNKKPYIYIIDHNPVQYNTDSAYVKKAFFTEYIGFPNILQSCRELLSIENLAWAQKLLNEISILTKYRRGKNDFVEAIKKGRIVALDVLSKNKIIQNKSLHIEFLDSYLNGIINNLTLYKKSIFKSTKNEVLCYNLCYMINDIEKIKKITLQNTPKTTRSHVLCV